MRASTAALLLLVLAACGPTTGTPTPTPMPTPSPGVTAAVTGSPGASLAVEIDPSLLAFLPSTVDGIAIIESPEVERSGAEDPRLADLAVGLAAGFAAEAEDWVVAVVVRLSPGALSEPAFRDWRDSFDEGVCELSGGVGGNAETEVGGRTVYIGTCTGGVRTYHVWLEAASVLVSAQSLGERRLGEHLVENLRP